MSNIKKNSYSPFQIFLDKFGKLNNFAHWIYLSECKPDDKTKCPSKSALVFLKTFKDSLEESIFFIFLSNNFKIIFFLF